MILKDAQNGKEYIVEKSMLNQPEKRRLEAMGLIEGTRILKLNQAIDSSTVFMVRGTRLAIGKELAENIIVRDVSPNDIVHKKRSNCMGRYACRKKGAAKGWKRGNRVW